MEFVSWWVSEIGHPPADPDEVRIFHMAYRAWRVALAHGDRSVDPAKVESALCRVGEGTSTADDETLLRQRIQVADLAAAVLEADLEGLANVRAFRQAEEEDQAEWMPKGASPMGGKRWRCPRCNFIAGLRKTETVCRGCNFPEEDTRDWTKPALEAVPDPGAGPDSEDES